MLGLARKVLVCDLDRTLWGGIVGEDGVSGIRVGPGSPEGEAYAELQRYLKELRARGRRRRCCGAGVISILALEPSDCFLPTAGDKLCLAP